MRFDPEQAVKKRTILITGKEAALRGRALAQVVQALGIGPDDFDFEEVLGDVRSPDEWIASVSTIPFLSEHRTLIVRHLLRAEMPPNAAVLLKSVPESGRLVLVADDEASGEEDKVRRQTNARTAWERAVASAGGAVAKCDVDSKTVASMLADEAKQLGKGLSAKAAMVLAEMSGGSFSRALDELQKLAVYVGDQADIREADVRAAATPSREWNVFKLVDAVVAGQPASALDQLAVLVGSTSKAGDAGNQSVLPQMSRQFRLLWQARACIESRIAPGSPPAGAGRLFLDKPNLSSEGDWIQRRSMDAARKVTFDQLAGCLAEVADADARLKGQLPAAGAMETLEMLVLRCVAIVQGRPVAPARAV